MTYLEDPVIINGFKALGESCRKKNIIARRAMIVGDSHTLPLYGKEVADSLKEAFDEIYFHEFPAGEASKQLTTIEEILLHLMELHFDRKDFIAALGGGVTGDMAGFAASVYLRGISYIQIPTSLLSQVDSSIGGKTGVDLHGYKNMIGAFHMPKLVYTNPDALRTLPEEQFASGMGEVIKTALLADASFFRWLSDNSGKVLEKESNSLVFMIRRSAEIKTSIVRKDPMEKGERALLNLGHTIGHAIEKDMNFTLLHGQCVGLGLIGASRISFRRGLIPRSDYEGIKDLCSRYGLPLKAEGIDPEKILALTKSDKKMKAGRIRFILLKEAGEAFYTDDVTDQEILDGIEAVTG